MEPDFKRRYRAAGARAGSEGSDGAGLRDCGRCWRGVVCGYGLDGRAAGEVEPRVHAELAAPRAVRRHDAEMAGGLRRPAWAGGQRADHVDVAGAGAGADYSILKKMPDGAALIRPTNFLPR